MSRTTERTDDILASIEAAVGETGDPHATRTYYTTDEEWPATMNLVAQRMVAIVDQGKPKGRTPAWIEVQLTRNGIRRLENA